MSHGLTLKNDPIIKFKDDEMLKALVLRGQTEGLWLTVVNLHSLDCKQTFGYSCGTFADLCDLKCALQDQSLSEEIIIGAFKGNLHYTPRDTRFRSTADVAHLQH